MSTSPTPSCSSPRKAFYETGIANRIDQWAQIASVFSTYESRHAKGEKPFIRGINSFQVFNDGQRWWVLNILWEAESRAERPLPERLAEAARGKAMSEVLAHEETQYQRAYCTLLLRRRLP